MERMIKRVGIKYKEVALDFVENVFAEYHKSGSGKLERAIVSEIREKKYYLPELELIIVNELDEIVGYVMFSKFPISGNYENEVLILTPVCVKTELQRQHISKELIEYGFNEARKLGYKAVIVEGGPKNYNSRGFETSGKYGIYADKKLKEHLPKTECLMVKELYSGSLNGITGEVSYDMYDSFYG